MEKIKGTDGSFFFIFFLSRQSERQRSKRIVFAAALADVPGHKKKKIVRRSM